MQIRLVADKDKTPTGGDKFINDASAFGMLVNQSTTNKIEETLNLNSKL